MKHGICLTPIYPHAIRNYSLMAELLEKISNRKLFNCVEVYFEGTKEEQYMFKNTLKDKDLEAVYLGGLPIKRDAIDISAADEIRRQKSVDACKIHLERALNMGCRKIVIASGPDWEKDGCQEKIAEQIRKSLNELEKCCRKEELQISLEPFPVSTEPYLAVGNVKLVQEIFQAESFQNVGITFDTSHFSQLGENVEKSFEVLMPWIHHVHLANCVMKDKTSPLYGDKHPVFSQEGGDFSVESIKKFYDRTILGKTQNRIDICSVEIASRGNEDWYYDETCKEAKKIWEEYSER